MAWTLDGSVVFVDISGFTKLSERLSRKGKEGAEQVTEAIERCFTELLAVAYANGGGLLKFGGDALLLFFEGPDHARPGRRVRGRYADRPADRSGASTSLARRSNCACRSGRTAEPSISSSRAIRTAR